MTFSLPFPSSLLKLPNLPNDDGYGYGNSTKQWYHWLKEEKASCRTCSTHFIAVLCITTTWNHQIQSERTNANLSFYIFTLKPLVKTSILGSLAHIVQKWRRLNNRERHCAKLHFEAVFATVVDLKKSLVYPPLVTSTSIRWIVVNCQVRNRLRSNYFGFWENAKFPFAICLSKADSHCTIFWRMRQAYDRQANLQLSQCFKTCFKMLRHFFWRTRLF